MKKKSDIYKILRLIEREKSAHRDVGREFVGVFYPGRTCQVISPGGKLVVATILRSEEFFQKAMVKNIETGSEYWREVHHFIDAFPKGGKNEKTT